MRPGLLPSASGADLTAAARERDAENIAPGTTVSKATGAGGISGGFSLGRWEVWLKDGGGRMTGDECQWPG